MSRTNPGNVKGRIKNTVTGKYHYIPWKGALDKDYPGGVRVDKAGHAIFDTPAWGYRALIRNLRSYQREGHFSSLYQTFRTYAPKTDTIGSIPGAKPNDPDGYARFVADRVAMRPDKPFEIFLGGKIVKPELLKELVQAIVVMENGHRFNFDEAAYADGVRLYEVG